MRIARMLVGLGLAGLAAAAGCGGGGGSSSPEAIDSLTVTPGASLARTVSGSGSMSFTVQGIDMDLDRATQPIVYFYDAKGYNGRGATGGFQGDLCNYRLRFYGSDGRLASSADHKARFRSDFSHDVVLEWQVGSDGYVRTTIDGSVLQRSGAVPSSFTIGVGYPPGAARGWDGATYTDISWPEGSTAVGANPGPKPDPAPSPSPSGTVNVSGNWVDERSGMTLHIAQQGSGLTTSGGKLTGSWSWKGHSGDFDILTFVGQKYANGLYGADRGRMWFGGGLVGSNQIKGSWTDTGIADETYHDGVTFVRR